MFCETGKCRDTEKIWAITSERKLHRLTFSHSLAQMIVKQHPQYKLERFGFRIGKTLEKGQKSASGLYALMSTKGHFALRISLMQEISDIHSDSSRYLAEAWIEI